MVNDIDLNVHTSSLKEIMTHFGRGTQLKKLSEELGELSKVCETLAIFFEQGEEDSEDADKFEVLEDFTLETADVLIVLSQLIEDLGVASQVESAADYKISRTLFRISRGYYDSILPPLDKGLFSPKKIEPGPDPFLSEIKPDTIEPPF